MINNNSKKLLEKRETIDEDLYAIQEMWQYLSYWQRKKLVLHMKYYAVRDFICKHFEAVRAVIVSACARVRSWVILRGDRADVPAIENLYAMSTEQERIDAFVLMARTIARRKRREHVRAVIVSACARAGMAAAGVWDLLTVSGLHVIYSLLFLLVFSAQ